jgi:hypothetical protein
MEETAPLTLERRGQPDKTGMFPAGAGAGDSVVMITPPLDEDYWEYRVQLSPLQAIVGFPKFMTIGIGFAREEDWNTNLPYLCGTEQIFQHIAHNKGDDGISDDTVREAIRLIQEAVREDRGNRDETFHLAPDTVSRGEK